MNQIINAFHELNYAPAPESAADARAWIEARGPHFDHWIDGRWRAAEAGERFEVRDPSTGQVIAEAAIGDATDVDRAVAAARRALPAWRALTGSQRARHLYALARAVQRNARLLATLESLDNGKPIRESRDVDIPLVARHFYHHAGWAQLAETELAGREPWGVCGQIIPWNFPLLMMAWKVAPALAAGNTVVLKPAEHTPLTALLLAELAAEAGLPPGLLNVVTGAGETGALLVEHEGVDKLAFTGSTEVGRRIRRATAGSGKGLTLELGGKSPFVVFEDADVDSAVEGLVDAIWFNQGQVCCAGSRLLVAESIAEDFHARLRRRMARLRVGPPLDKAVDIGAIVAEVQLERIRELCDIGKAEGARCWQPEFDLPESGYFFPPTLFTEVAPASTIAREEIFGPVLVSMSFRSPAEAIELANDTRYGLAASVWTQDLDTALAVSRAIRAGTVWVNCTNLFDAASGFGGYQESGFGREGGREGMQAYLRPVAPPRQPADGLGRAAKGRRAEADNGDRSRIDRTAKLYIGGRQRRPDGGYSLSVASVSGRSLGQVARGNRKDIRDAVEAARSQVEWAKASAHSRAQVLYYLGENLAARRGVLVERVDEALECGLEAAEREVEAAVDACFTWAAWSDKHDGAVHGVPLRGLVLALHEPHGLVGLVCPDAAPLSGLLGLAGPLMACGNRVIALPSQRAPLLAAELYQMLEASDLPGGTLNLITGLRSELAPVLADHDGLDALWLAGDGEGDPALAADCEARSVGNLKQTWCLPAGIDWQVRDAEFERERLRRAVQVKNLWLPQGI